MSLDQLWNRGQLRTSVRRELNDTSGTLSWSWSDTELNQLLGDWQDLIQDHSEFTWGSATLTSVTTATITLTNVANNILRFDSIWWNGLRLGGRDKEELEISIRDWRAVQPGNPQTCYQDDPYSVSVFPPPSTGAIGTSVIFEYPVRCQFIDDTTAMQVPAWTKYSAVPYVAWRALVRPGPNQDFQKAAAYEQKFRYLLQRYRTIWINHLPAKGSSLRPGGRYEGDILTLGQHNTLFQSWM